MFVSKAFASSETASMVMSFFRQLSQLQESSHFDVSAVLPHP
jgi:hypothetical protein